MTRRLLENAITRAELEASAKRNPQCRGKPLRLRPRLGRSSGEVARAVPRGSARRTNEHRVSGAAMTAETYPQWWIARRCIHWDAARNRRFRLIRVDGPSDHAGRKPSYQFDADTGVLHRMPWGVGGHMLLRRANAKEIPGDLFMEIMS